MRAIVKNGLGPKCVAATEKAFVSGWGDGHIRCHDNATGALLWTLPDAHTGGVSAIAVANGQHFFVSGGEGGEVRVWDMRTRGMISTLKEHSGRVVGVAVLRDDVHVVSASRDRSIITWDLIRERRVSQHQQRVGTGFQQGLLSGKHNLFFPFVRARGNPHRPVSEHFGAQFAAAELKIRR